MIGNATDPAWKCGIDLDCVQKAVPIDVDGAGEYTNSQGILFVCKDSGAEVALLEVDPDETLVAAIIQGLIQDNVTLESVEDYLYECIAVHYADNSKYNEGPDPC